MQKPDSRRSTESKSKKQLQQELENLYSHLEDCGLCDIPNVEVSLSHILLQDKRSQGVIMDLALDAIVIIDDSGAIVSFNRSAEALFGYRRSEVKGRLIADVIIPPALRQQHHDGFERYLETGVPHIIDRRVEVRAMRADGSEFPIELTVTAFHARGVRYFTAFIRDISRRLEMEQRIRQEKELVQLLHRLTSLANEASNTLSAMKGFLREVCEYTGWPVGHVYMLEEDDPCPRLVSSRCWYLADEKRFRQLKQITERTVFNVGEGIPGRVLATGKPVWIEDISADDNFPRARVSGELEVRTSFALPVVVGQDVVAVLEFFTPEYTENDETFLGALSHIGIELGRVIERDRSAEQLRYLADHDALTGLPNLRVGRDRLNQLVVSGKRQKRPFALFYLDLDGFKKINDSQGHEAGDRALKVVAGRIAGTLRDMDTVARIGGDEFFVLLSGIESKASVALVAEKLIEVISRPIASVAVGKTLGASIGIALFPDDACEADELSRLADKAMYAVKNQGKNSYRFYADIDSADD
ncbi:MAG: diguanylate cyclase [Sedimenticola sp.]|nr:diguanylate cyclase [Sedimenticola sp.]